MSRCRFYIIASWILCLLAYLMPWVKSNIGILPAFKLIPFTTLYVIGLALGLIPLWIKAYKLLLAILACVLMITSILCVIFYWYSLALHYVATGGGVAELEIGVWFAFVTAIVYLLLNTFCIKLKLC